MFSYHRLYVILGDACATTFTTHDIEGGFFLYIFGLYFTQQLRHALFGYPCDFLGSQLCAASLACLRHELLVGVRLSDRNRAEGLLPEHLAQCSQLFQFSGQSLSLFL